MSVTVSPSRAQAIRDRFSALASEGRAHAAVLRTQGETLAASALERQCQSWDRMSLKPYEALPIVGAL